MENQNNLTMKTTQNLEGVMNMKEVADMAMQNQYREEVEASYNFKEDSMEDDMLVDVDTAYKLVNEQLETIVSNSTQQDEEAVIFVPEEIEVEYVSIEDRFRQLINSINVCTQSTEISIPESSIILTNLFNGIYELWDRVKDINDNIPSNELIKFSTDPEIIIETIIDKYIDVLSCLKQLRIVDDIFVSTMMQQLKYVDDYIYTLMENEAALSYVVFVDVINTIAASLELKGNLDLTKPQYLDKTVHTIRVTLETVDCINSLIDVLENGLYAPSTVRTPFNQATHHCHNEECMCDEGMEEDQPALLVEMQDKGQLILDYSGPIKEVVGELHNVCKTTLDVEDRRFYNTLIDELESYHIYKAMNYTHDPIKCDNIPDIIAHSKSEHMMCEVEVLRGESIHRNEVILRVKIYCKNN